MAASTTIRGLLYHSTHGLCRIVSTTDAEDKEKATYIIRPVTYSRAKVRIAIGAGALESSGFTKLISKKEGQDILKFFKTAAKKSKKKKNIWEFAEHIKSEASSTDMVRNMRRRQDMDRAVKGLVGQLACVLDLSSFEVAELIQKNLSHIKKINPLVPAALKNIKSD